MPIGGAERVLCDILAKFNYDVYDVSLLLYNNCGALLSSVSPHVKILSLYGTPSNSLFTKIREKLYRLINLRRRIDKRRTLGVVDSWYDAIISFCHGHGHMIHSFISDHSANNISWIHSDLSVGNWGVQFFDNDIKKQEIAYNRMNKIVYVSNDAKNAFHKVFNVSPNVHEAVVYNFVNVDLIKQKAQLPLSGVHHRKFTFINVGRLIEAKNQDRIIQASKLLRDQGYDFEFWIVGDGPLYNSLRNEIAYCQLEDTVKLMGAQSNPYNFLNAADCFVLTSHQEGFSIAIVEAFVLGKPVITMRSSGPTELVGKSVFGILIEQNVNELVSSMKSIMTQHNIYEYYSIKALERAKDFTGEKSMKYIERIIDSI